MPHQKIDAEKLKKSFQVFDDHPNGILSLAEIDKALMIVCPDVYKEKPAIMRAYKAADASSDGFISKEEFGRFVDLLMYYFDAIKMFEKVDKDGDRRITLDEFKKSRKTFGLDNSSDEQVKKEFDAIDTNKGGMILFEEFCIYLAKKKIGK
ncbi:hypothetical protein HDV05_007457 [Chytridiales sp. JEL 0842]|nr:hypothetical protein HDV05_007457 [Chytridiales sp. JEL 0842]